jgi:hypothetical protein
MISRASIAASWLVASAICAVIGVWIGVSLQDAAPSGAVASVSVTPSLNVGRATSAVAFSAVDPPIAELHSRSPFDEARRPFQRGPIEPPPPPPPPPRLLGISSKDGVRSALVEWRPSGETQNLSLGIQTPQGVVSRIGESDLVLKAGDTELVISMFD